MEQTPNSVKIYEIRGQKIMLANDIAHFYDTDIQSIQEILDHHKKKFRSSVFRLTFQEWNFMRMQSENESLPKKIQGSPLAFTTHGVLLMGSLLNTAKANEITKLLIESYIQLKQMSYTHFELSKCFIKIQGEHQMDDAFEIFDRLLGKSVYDLKNSFIGGGKS